MTRTKRWRRWTPEEDRAILAARWGELKPLARKLEHSYTAARQRRALLQRAR